MEWTPGGSDQDIEDRRDESGESGGPGLSGGGGFGGFGAPHLGIGGLLVLGVLSVVFHQNFFALFSGGSSTSSAPSGSSRPYRAPDPSQMSEKDRQEQPQYEFIKFVLNDTQKEWDEQLEQQTRTPYRHAKLVLYRDSYPSACGQAQSAIGPFYCPGDEKVYLDLGFLNELADRFGAPGQFAQAYVVAHEIGHHVQKILGIEAKVRRLQRISPDQENPLSVKLELQADCLAGVWGNSTRERGIVKEADIKQGLAAAAAVGDDRLQKMARGQVSPESFTHGSSAQRTSWFRKGLESGRVASCDTFAE